MIPPIYFHYMKWSTINFSFTLRKLAYKIKDDTVRIYFVPRISIELFYWEFTLFFGDESYWDRYIWIKYNDGDVTKAYNTWPWISAESGESDFFESSYFKHKSK